MSAPVHKVDARFVEWNDMNGEDRARGGRGSAPRLYAGALLDPLAVCHRLSALVRPTWKDGVPPGPSRGRPNARLFKLLLIPTQKRKTLPLLW